MRRLWGLALILLFGAIGCAADDDKGQWDAFWKDLRGDNMQMKSSGRAIGGWGAGQQN